MTREYKKQNNVIIRTIFLLCIITFFVIGYNTNYYQISNLLFLLFMWYSLLYKLLFKQWKVNINYEIISIGLFTIYSFISLMWAPDFNASIVRLKTVVLLLFLLLAIYNCFCEEDAGYLIKTIWLSGSFMLIFFCGMYGLKQIISGIGDYSYRFGDEAGGINVVAEMTAIYIVVSVYYFLYEKKTKMLISVCAGCTVLASTQSRSGLLFVLIGIIVLFIIYRWTLGQKLSVSIILSFFFFILCALTFCVLNTNFIQHVLHRYNLLLGFVKNSTSQEDYSSYIRFHLLKIGYALFKRNPLFGYGIGSGYSLISGNYFHNNYIQILVELGIIGFFMYYFSFFHIIRKLMKHIRGNKYCSVGLALLVGILLTDISTCGYYKKETFIILGINLCLCKVSSKMKRRKAYNEQQNNNMLY